MKHRAYSLFGTGCIRNTLERVGIAGLFIIMFNVSTFAQKSPTSQYTDGPSISVKHRGTTENYILEQWNTDNGLPQNSVNAMVQTKDRYIWLATYDGLVRFDGLSFTVYTMANTPALKSNRIETIVEDKRGTFWVAPEENGILLYRNGIFRKLEDTSINAATIFCFAEENDSTMWAATPSRLVKIVNYKVVQRIPLHLYWNFAPRALLPVAGGMYLGAIGLYYYDGTQVRMVKDFSTAPVRSFLQQGDSILLATGKGLYSLRNRVLRKIELPEGKNSPFVSSLYCDREKNIWLGQVDVTLSRLNRQGEYEDYHHVLPPDEIYRILQDNEGNIWLGAQTTGLWRLRKSAVRVLSKANGLSSDIIYPILRAHDGTVYIGTNGGGINILRGNSLTRFLPGTEYSKLAVWSIAEDCEHTLWIGTYGFGVYRYDKSGKMTRMNEGIWSKLNNLVYAIHFDDLGAMWIGTDNGLGRYYNGTLKIYTTNDGLVNNSVRNLFSDRKGRLWVATTGGLSILDGGKITSYTDKKGLSANYIRAFTEDDMGNIWIGSYGGGIMRFQNGRFSTIAQKDGLYDNIISTILDDSQGNYWMTCNKGIFRVKKSELNEFADGVRKYVSSFVINKASGLLKAECNGGCQPSSCRTPDGNLWFPTFGGVAIINPVSLQKNTTPPRVYIEKVLVDTANKRLNEPIIAPPGYERIDFMVAALCFTDAAGVKFSYLIEGLDEHWSTPTTNRLLQFSHLPAGRYTLKVIACNNDGVWTSTPAQVEFEIREYFYKTPFFYIVLVLFIVGIIAGAFQLRIHILEDRRTQLENAVTQKTADLQNEKLKTEQALRETTLANAQLEIAKAKAEQESRQKTEILSIITHDLRNPLFCIRGSAEMLPEEHEDPTSLQKLVNLIIDSADKMLELVNHMLEHVRLDDFNLRLYLHTIKIVPLLETIILKNSSLAAKKGQKITFMNYIPVEAKVVADEVKFLSAIDNLVSNAVKYSPRDSAIIVRAQTDGKKYVISVKDQGPGLTDEDKKKIFGTFQRLSAKPTGGEISTGLGLSIAKRIVELHDGEITVISEAGQGAEFIIELPVSIKPSSRRITSQIE